MSHSEYREGTSLADMIREDLVAERIAIETYREIINYFGTHDPTSRLLMKQILTKEEEHVDESPICSSPSARHRQGCRHLYFDDEVPEKARPGKAAKA